MKRNYPDAIRILALCLTLIIISTQKSSAEEADQADAFPTSGIITVARRQAMMLDLDFSRSGKWLAAAGDSVRVFNPRSGKMIMTTATPRTTRYVCFSPIDEKEFVTVADDGKVRIFEVGKAEPKLVVNAHPGRMVLGLAYSPDGKSFATSSVTNDGGELGKGQFKVWDSKTGKQLLEKNVRGACQALAFAPDGASLGIAVTLDMAKSSVEIYDTKDWRLKDKKAFSPGFAASVAFSPDGKRLVVTGGECENRNKNGCNPTGKIWIFELGSDEPPLMLRPEPRHDYFRSISFTESGTTFVTGSSQTVREPRQTFLQAELQCRDTKSGELRWAAKGGIGDAYGAKSSPDGILAAYCIDTRVYLVDASNGKKVHEIAVEVTQ